MQDNKISISLTTVIMIAVVIVALILGIISYVVYNNFSEDTEARLENNKIGQSTLDFSSDAEKNDNTNITEIKNNNSNSNVNSINQEDVSNTSQSNSSLSNSITGKTSSKQNPLEIGEWGIASKYSSGEYIDVPARVTKVTRGASAAQEVKDYLNNGYSIYKYEDAKENMEWSVIEYDIDLTKMEEESVTNLYTAIAGTGNNISIKYNNVTYIVSTINITPNNYKKGEIVSCKFATQLPIGCTDYLIVLGSLSHTQAFFNGK